MRRKPNCKADIACIKLLAAAVTVATAVIVMLRLAMLLAAVAAAVAAAAQQPQQPQLPRGWVLDAAATTEQAEPLTVALALRLSTRAELALERTFEQVSDPQHARYGQHLSAAELQALLQDDHLSHCQRTVEDWLRLSSAEVVRVAADAVHVTAGARVIERLFAVQLRPYRRSGAPEAAVAFRAEPGLQPQLPAPVQRCVDVVSGLLSTELAAVPRHVTSTTLRVPPPPKGATTWPAMLAQLYGLPTTVANTGATRSRQATANFIGQYYQKSDLDTFFAEYAPSLQGVYPLLVGPGNATGTPGSEASLDLQYIMPTATVSVPTEFWSAPAHESLFPWAQRLNAVRDDWLL